MASLTNDHVRRLRVALQAVYAGPRPQEDYWLFLYDRLNVQLTDLTSASSFPLQIVESTIKLDRDGRAHELLTALELEYPQAAALVQVISDVRTDARLRPRDIEATNRLKALEQGYLLLDGLPFIDRDR